MGDLYREFRIRHFRGHRELFLRDLSRVNLIAGKNNVGKTAVLEALFVHSAAYSPELALRVNAFRGLDAVKIQIAHKAEAPWESLFTDFNTSETVELEGDLGPQDRRLLRLYVVRSPEELARLSHFVGPRTESAEEISQASEAIGVLGLEYVERAKSRRYYLVPGTQGLTSIPIPPAAPFRAVYQGSRTRISLPDLAEWFSNLQVRGEERSFINALRIVEPRLESVSLLLAAGQPLLHGRLDGGRPIPLPLMGEGMMRLTALLLAIAAARDGVALVDEVENGLHHSVLGHVWRVIHEASQRFNVQIFCTTHSRECIVAAHRTFSESEPYDFRVHRLERNNDQTRSITYDKETLAAAVETEFEVR